MSPPAVANGWGGGGGYTPNVSRRHGSHLMGEAVKRSVSFSQVTCAEEEGGGGGEVPGRVWEPLLPDRPSCCKACMHAPLLKTSDTQQNPKFGLP